MLPLLILAAAAGCPKGLTELEDACVVAPDEPAPLVIYFHGMFPGSTDWSKVRELRLLGAEAKKRGFAFIALKGEQGLCSWSKDVQQYWCWPNDLSQLKDVGRTLLRLGRVRGQVKAKGPPVFAGFSNGGYFTSLIASDSMERAKGFVVLQAGNVTGETFPPERREPTLIVGAKRDPIQLPVAMHLFDLLTVSGWPVKLVVREGVHEITGEDAKLIFDFASSLAEPDADAAQPQSAEPASSGKPPSGSDTGAGVKGGGSSSPVR